uniref:Polyprotein allergen nematode domain-containing protein n=1 Tax=Meloidogyne javanica TaxID=6303 RepID=A0A915LG45_MELJA
ARDYGPACKRIFALSMAVPPTTSRRRRECAQCSERLKHAIKTHLSWLSDEQKAELKADEIAGKTREETKEKVMKWFEAIGEESEKEKARELMKGGCRELIKELLGEEAASKIKQMKEGGATPEALTAEIDKLMGEITDEKKKETAALYSSACKQVFGIKASRKRRESNDELDEETKKEFEKEILEILFDTSFEWLNEGQREELEEDLANGKSLENEIYKKTEKWFKELEMLEREKVNKQILINCLGLNQGMQRDNARLKIRYLTLEDKLNLTSLLIIKKEQNKLLHKSKIIGKFCVDMTEEVKFMRKRRDHHHGHGGGHTLEDYFKTHLSCHLRKLAEEYKPVCTQLFGVGEEKKPAGRKRRDHHHGHGGGHTLEDYFKTHLSWLDDGQKENLKTMKGEGKTREEMQKKVNHLRKLAEEYKPVCTQLFGVGEASVSRKRRSWKDIYGKKKLNNRGYDDEEEEEDEGYSNPRVSNIEDNDEQTRTDMGRMPSIEWGILLDEDII